MSEYMVRTQSGEKGPFTLDQLEKFVAAGKLPVTINVFEVESGLALPLADLVTPIETAPPPVDEVPAPAQSAPARRAPSRSAPSRSAPSSRGRRATGGAARTARGSAPGARRSSAGGARKSSRYTPQKKTSGATIGIITVIVLLAGGGGGYFWWINNASLIGNWVIDEDAMRPRMIKEAKRESPGQNEAVLGAGVDLGLALIANMSLEFTKSDCTFRFGDMADTGTYKVLSKSKGVYRLQITGPAGEETTQTVTILKRKLHMQEDGRTIIFRRS